MAGPAIVGRQQLVDVDAGHGDVRHPSRHVGIEVRPDAHEPTLLRAVSVRAFMRDDPAGGPAARGRARGTRVRPPSRASRGRPREIGSTAAIRPGRRRHHDDPVGQDDGLGDRVGDEHDGRAGALPEVEQQIPHLGAGDLVECGERFVHEQDRRAEREPANERHPLLHAAGELVGVRPAEVAEPDRVDQVVDVAVGQRRRVAAAAGVERREEADVALDGRPRHQRRRLRHETVLLGLAGGRGLLSGHLDDATIGLHEPADHPEQRGFPAARGSEQAHEFTASDVEVDRTERLDDLSAAAEDLVDTTHRHVEVGARLRGARHPLVPVHGVVHGVWRHLRIRLPTSYISITNGTTNPNRTGCAPMNGS